MKKSEIFRLQNNAAIANVRQYKTQFQWCYCSVELMIDTHTFLANDPQMLSYRESMRKTDVSKFEVMNVVVNLAYDALGSLISALRLVEYGLLADAWSLIRGAFESTCYAEYFTLNPDKVKNYLQIGDAIKHNHSVNVIKKYRQAKLTISDVRQCLEKCDSEDRRSFYGRLSNFGTHASPVRAGFRARVDEPEVRVYLSIGHRYLIQCLADFAATAKYTMSIPFDTWPDLMQSKCALVDQYQLLLNKYESIYKSS